MPELLSPLPLAEAIGPPILKEQLSPSNTLLLPVVQESYDGENADRALRRSWAHLEVGLSLGSLLREGPPSAKIKDDRDVMFETGMSALELCLEDPMLAKENRARAALLHATWNEFVDRSQRGSGGVTPDTLDELAGYTDALLSARVHLWKEHRASPHPSDQWCFPEATTQYYLLREVVALGALMLSDVTVYPSSFRESHGLDRTLKRDTHSLYIVEGRGDQARKVPLRIGKYSQTIGSPISPHVYRLNWDRICDEDLTDELTASAEYTVPAGIDKLDASVVTAAKFLMDAIDFPSGANVGIMERIAGGMMKELVRLRALDSKRP